MPKPLRTALSVAVAATFGLVPAVMVASPSYASDTTTVNDLTISDAANWEGGKLAFTVTYTGTGPGVFTFATAPGTAVGVGGAGVPDYIIAPDRTAITFPGTLNPGTNTATVTVSTLINSAGTEAANETVSLVATDDQTSPGTKAGTGTIWESGATTFTLRGPSSTLPETATATGQRIATVTATLSAPVSHDVTIPVEAVTDTGVGATLRAVSSGGVLRDFTALAAGAAIVIPATQLSGSVDVSLWDDSVDEVPIQWFVVQVPSAGTPLGATISGSAPEIGITDDDAAPTVKIGDALAASEGNSLAFPVTLSSLSESIVSVEFDTSNGTDTATTHGATSAVDYTSVSTTAQIQPYNQSATVLVPTLHLGAALEGTETMTATLSAPVVNATLGTPLTATGTITDIDAGPTVGQAVIGSGPTFVTGDTGQDIVEGDTGDRATYINVAIGASANRQVPLQLNYSFTDVTATNGVDYRGTAGSFTIPVSTATPVTVQIPVTIVGDLIYEPTDTFNVVLTSPNGTVGTGLGATLYSIIDSTDAQPTWTTGNISVAEGNSGTTMARVPITLNTPTNVDVTFNANIQDDGAHEGGVSTGTTVGENDYDYPTVQAVTVTAGSTTGYLDIPINGDTIYEHAETFTVAFTEPAAVLSPSTTDLLHTARVTITNDDAAPTVSFNQLAGTEGSTIRVTATTTGLSQDDYKIGFTVGATGTNPATAGTDYEVETTPLPSYTVLRGSQGALPLPSTLTDVYLTPDDIDEATETFGVTATETTPSPIGVNTATGVYRINDDPADLPPTASISDESIKEDEGSVDVTVSLAFTGDTTSSTQPFTLSYYTVDGSAVAGQDYTETRGTLTIPAGTMSKTINVPIKNDKLVESDQDFFVKIGTPGPAGATLGKYVGDVIIHSDDTGSGEPAPTISAPASINGPGSVLITGSATTAGSWVELWGAPFGSPLENIVGISAKAGGAYAFSKYLAAGYKFQVKANGKSSAVKEVWVKELLALSTSAGKGTIGMSATGNPKTVNTMVSFQIQNSHGTWVTLGTDKTGPTGNATATLKKLKSGSRFSCRAVIAGTPAMGISSGTSAVKVVTVK